MGFTSGLSSTGTAGQIKVTNQGTAMGFTSGLSSTGTAGQIKVTNQGTAIDLVVDVIGYYAATTSGSGSFTPAASRIAGAVVVAGGAT
jgi:hypothetical protein